MICQYKGCNKKPFEESLFCILHLNFPKKENGSEFDKIKKLKLQEFENKKNKNDFNFNGAKLYSADLDGIQTKKDVFFTNATIKENFNCNHAKIDGDIWFDGINIGGHCSLEMTYISGTVSFFKGYVKGNINFDKSKIGNYAWFEEFQTDGESSFNHTTIGSSSSFKKSIIAENVSFYGAQIGGYSWFDDAVIGGNTWFDLAEIKGGLSFKNTIFKNIRGKERAYRSAKIIWERLGDRERSDYHFYHEMEAKRKQKPFYVKYPELIVQYSFGYGVHPSRLFFTFIFVLMIFALIYWLIKGKTPDNNLFDNIRFSFLTLLIPAYGVINAKTGFLGLLIILEAFIGAFTWPTFIVTFARKYMR